MQPALQASAECNKHTDCDNSSDNVPFVSTFIQPLTEVEETVAEPVRSVKPAVTDPRVFIIIVHDILLSVLLNTIQAKASIQCSLGHPTIHPVFFSASF